MPGHAKSPKLTLDEWKAKCVTVSDDLGLAVGDMWDKDDPYELDALAQEAFEADRTPKSFVAEIFEEDLARQAGEEDEFNQSMDEAYGEED